MLLINLLVLTVSVWIILVVNYRFIQPALKNQQRFKLYKLRDELSILAMKGILDEHSDEYQTLTSIQNATIRASSSFKVTDYLRFLLRFHRDEKIRKKLSKVMGKLDKAEDVEYCRIARDSFDVMHAIMRRDTRTLRYAFFPLLMTIGTILMLVKCTVPKEQLDKKKHLIKEIDDDLDCYSSEFGKGCAA